MDPGIEGKIGEGPTLDLACFEHVDLLQNSVKNMVNNLVKQRMNTDSLYSIQRKLFE